MFLRPTGDKPRSHVMPLLDLPLGLAGEISEVVDGVIEDVLMTTFTNDVLSIEVQVIRQSKHTGFHNFL